MLEARSGPLLASSQVLTSVSGIADLEMEVTEQKRVLDVGESTVFEVKIRNVGTKAAKNLLIRMKLSENVKAEEYNGFDEGDITSSSVTVRVGRCCPKCRSLTTPHCDGFPQFRPHSTNIHNRRTNAP